MIFISLWAGEVDVDTKETASNLECKHCPIWSAEMCCCSRKKRVAWVRLRRGWEQ